MEFREQLPPFLLREINVDIGTEWNLELVYVSKGFMRSDVDIGTEWNLEITEYHFSDTLNIVDIGTEWNLE